MTTTGTTPGAKHFITGTTTTVVEASAAEFITVPEQRPGRSAETPRLLEGTGSLVVRVAFAQGLSATTGMAARQEATPHRGEAALVAADSMAEDMAAGDTGNRSLVLFPGVRRLWKWRESKCIVRR